MSKPRATDSEKKKRLDLFSVTALCVSLFTLYQTWVRPFDPRFSLDYVGVDRRKEGTNFLVPMTITNHGPTPGTIDELAIEVTLAGRHLPEWLYRADFMVDEVAFLCKVRQASEPSHQCGQLEQQTFRPISILGREQASVVLAFFPVQSQRVAGFEGSAQPLLQGEYQMKLLARIDGDPKFVEIWQLSFGVSNDIPFNLTSGKSAPLLSLAPSDSIAPLARRWW